MKQLFSWGRLERCALIVAALLVVLYSRNPGFITLAGWLALQIILTLIAWSIWALFTVALAHGKRR